LAQNCFSPTLGVCSYTLATMPHGPRRFAKNSADTRTFRLQARSQHDTEGEDPDASPLVLEPFVTLRDKKAAAKKGIDEEELLAIPESLHVLGPEVFGIGGRPAGIEFSSDEEEYEEDGDDLKELDDDCYFPKDGYNYNKHLKTVSTGKKNLGGVIIKAPEKLWTSDITVADEKTIMIQQPTTTEEQELMAALDWHDADLYEELDDDILEEIVPSGVLAPAVVLWGESAAENQDLPDLAMFKAMHAQRMAAADGSDDDEPCIDDDDCQYAPRAEGAVSAAEFDQLLEDEYGDDGDGALEEEEIQGPVDIENMGAVLDEFLEESLADKMKWETLLEPQEQKLCDCPRVIEETKALIARHYEVEDAADEDTSEGETNEDESKNWDCETVLSTLSNVSNRPGKINKIKSSKVKPGKDLPAIVETGSDSESDDDAVELPDVVTERPKNETPEEKKLRKAAVKEMRKICRKMKKESKEMYKVEAAKLSAKKANGCDVRQGLRTNKL